ncbi:hypothetical protein J4416_01580 [Candidatus Pacearchaeota archaeon]|nr:hypothetical protein [uncultured archaeon]AQS34490.1 hypothetical protein [uncultured archaeon]MBS3081613.1 hypothetical protein [Candidatus Pacearchaeota archaeon]
MKFTLNSYNSLLHRHDVIAKKNYPSNPGLSVVREDIAKHFDKPIDCVVVVAIRGSFGSSEFVLEARVYDSVENLQSIEPKLKIKKGATNG